jgi:hypothetical protein
MHGRIHTLRRRVADVGIPIGRISRYTRAVWNSDAYWYWNVARAGAVNHSSMDRHPGRSNESRNLRQYEWVLGHKMARKAKPKTLKTMDNKILSRSAFKSVSENATLRNDELKRQKTMKKRVKVEWKQKESREKQKVFAKVGIRAYQNMQNSEMKS